MTYSNPYEMGAAVLVVGTESADAPGVDIHPLAAGSPADATSTTGQPDT